MTLNYNLTLTDGSALTTIYSAEGNGLDNKSVPRQILYISFGPTTPSITVSGDVTARFVDGFPFDIIGGTAYDGSYEVFGIATTELLTTGKTVTHIPVSAITQSTFSVVNVVDGLNGSWIISGPANGEVLFYPESTFTIAGNTLPAANNTYTVQSSNTSEVYAVTNIIDGLGGTFTIAGDQTLYFIPGTTIDVRNTFQNLGDGIYTITTATLNAGNTDITIVETIPVGTVSQLNTTLTNIIPITVVTVTGTIPVGAASDGTASPAAITAYSIIAPIGISPIIPNTYDVIWRIAGDETGQILAGFSIRIENAVYNGNPYNQELIVTSTTFVPPSGPYPTGITEIHTTVVDSAVATPVITYTGSTNVVFPPPSLPYGHLQYTVQEIDTSLKLIGPGSATYNNSLTWGHTIQDNAVHMLEHFSDTLPPTAPLNGQVWFENNIPSLQVFNGSKYPIIGVITGLNGTFTLTGNLTADPKLQPGKTIIVYGNAGMSFVVTSYTVSSITLNVGNTDIVINESIPAGASQALADGTFGLLYPYDNWYGIVTEVWPVQGDIDMNNHSIFNLADTAGVIPTNAQDALNVQSADLLYVAKTGGVSAGRNGIMTGVLTMETTGGIDVNSAPVTMFGTSSLTFDAAGTGDIEILGTGDIHVAQGNVNIDVGNLIVGGDLTVSGTQTILNTTTLTVEDKNIELGVATTPTDVTADGGGITLKGTTDKTIIWDDANDNWTSSEHWNLASLKEYKINNVSVLNATTLGTAVVTSSLTAVGTIATGTWEATDIGLAHGGTNASLVAVNGGIVYSDAAAMAITAAGTTKQVLQSNGAAAPTWETMDLTFLPSSPVKTSVIVATTGDITLSGSQLIDGVTVNAGDRVLVKTQTLPEENGIYDVVDPGTWTRSEDANSAVEVSAAVVSIQQGTLNGGLVFTTTFKSTDSIGVTAMNWYQFVNTGIAQTIAGAKTFSDATVVNNSLTIAADGTNTNLLADTAGFVVTGQSVSVGTAYQVDLTAGNHTAGAGGNLNLTTGDGSTVGGNLVLTTGIGAGVTTSGYIHLLAGNADLQLDPLGAWLISTNAPTLVNQAIISNPTNPTTDTPVWGDVAHRVAAAPTATADPGNAGDYFVDSGFVYFYVTGTGWVRAVVATF